MFFKEFLQVDFFMIGYRARMPTKFHVKAIFIQCVLETHIEFEWWGVWRISPPGSINRISWRVLRTDHKFMPLEKLFGDRLKVVVF